MICIKSPERTVSERIALVPLNIKQFMLSREKTSVSKLMESGLSQMFFNLGNSVKKETLDEFGISLIISEIERFQGEKKYDPTAREKFVEKLSNLLKNFSKKLYDNSIASGSNGPRFEETNQNLQKIRKFLDQLEVLIMLLKQKSL